MPKFKKIKVTIDPRKEDLPEFDGKLRESDGFALPDDEQFAEAADGAGWSDDPGEGRAILLADGREVGNPLPVAAPVVFAGEMSVNELVERSLKAHYELIAENAAAQETLEELLTFEEDDDLEPASPWEVVERVLPDEVPEIPKPAVVVVDPPPGVGVTVVADGVPPPKTVEPKPPAA